VYKFNRTRYLSTFIHQLILPMTEFLLPLAKNYAGINILDDIYSRHYPGHSEEKNNRFDPVIANTAMFMLNISDKYADSIYVVRVPIGLRDLCTIASDGGCTGGEKIYLLPSKVPIIQRPITMSCDDVKEFINNNHAARRCMLTQPIKIPDHIKFRRSVFVRTQRPMSIEIPKPDTPRPRISHGTLFTNEKTLSAMYEE
jgi:hypothetical protein